MALFEGLIKESKIIANPAEDSTPLANKAFQNARGKYKGINTLKDFFAFMQNNQAFFGDKVLSEIKARIEEARKLGNLRQYRVVNPETLEMEGFGYKQIMDRIIDDQPFVASAKINYLLANLDKVIELLSLEDVNFDSFNQIKTEGNCTDNLNHYVLNLAKHADKLHLVEGNLGDLSDTKEEFLGVLDEAVKRYPAVAAAEIETFVTREKKINAEINEILQQLVQVGAEWNEHLMGLSETYKIINELNSESFNLLTEKEEFEKLNEDFKKEIISREEDENLKDLENTSWLKQVEFKEKKLSSLLQKHQERYLNTLHELASKQTLLKKVDDNYKLYQGLKSITPFELMTLIKNNFVVYTNNTIFDKDEKDYEKLSENVLFLTEKQNAILELEYLRLCDAMEKRDLTSNEKEFTNFIKDYRAKRDFNQTSFETRKEIFNFINERRASLYKMLTEKEQVNFDSFYIDTLLTKHIMNNLDTVHTMLQLQSFKNAKRTLETIIQENTYTSYELNEEMEKNYTVYNNTLSSMTQLQEKYKELDLNMQKYKNSYYQPYKNLGFATFAKFNTEMADTTFPKKKEVVDKSGYFDGELVVPEINMEELRSEQERYGCGCTDEIENIEKCMNSEEKDDATKVLDSLHLITKDDRHKTNIRKTIVNHTIAFTEFVSILNNELFTIQEENK